MKKTILIVLAISTFALLLSQTIFAEMSNKAVKVVALQVKTKDPFIAYNLAIIPVFGPIAACNYLASSPITWKENIPEIKSRATTYTILNVVTIIAGVYCMTASYEEKTATTPYYVGYDSPPDDEINIPKFMIGLLLIEFVPIIENRFFGAYCAKWTVNYNKKLYKQFNYAPPPTSLNLQEEGINLSYNMQF